MSLSKFESAGTQKARQAICLRDARGLLHKKRDACPLGIGVPAAAADIMATAAPIDSSIALRPAP